MVSPGRPGPAGRLDFGGEVGAVYRSVNGDVRMNGLGCSVETPIPHDAEQLTLAGLGLEFLRCQALAQRNPNPVELTEDLGRFLTSPCFGDFLGGV